MSKNTSYDPQKEFESLLYSLEAGGSYGENLLRSILAGGSYRILTTIHIFIEEPLNYKEVERLTNLLRWTEREDISKLYPKARVELGRQIAECLRKIATYVPENKRSDFCESLVGSILTPYSSRRVGRQREYQSSPRTQPVSQPSGAQPQAGGQYSQQSSVLTYQEFVEIREKKKSEREVAKSLIGRGVYLPGGIKGEIVNYDINQISGKLFVYVETKDGTWYGLTLEDLEKYLKKSSKSNRSYLILFLIALSGVIPLVFLRAPVSSLFLLPSKHHFSPLFILFLSLALFLLAKRALK